MNEIRINVPEGMEIDKENSTFECIKFKPKLNIKRGDFVYVKSKRGVELKFIYKETCSGKLFGWEFFNNGTITEIISQSRIKIIRRMDDIEYEAAMNTMKKCGLRWNPDTLEVEKISRLPKTWEEFCEVYPLRKKEYYIDNTSNICEAYNCGIIRRNSIVDKNLLPDKETTEAILALQQLIQLRDCYNDGWKPDWEANYPKHTIYVANGEIISNPSWTISMILTFKSEELRDQFLENFRDLIEIAKPLI